jgi:hypothetical protein
LLLAAFGWLTMSGHTYARDEETVFATAVSLFDRHQFALPEGLPVVEVRRGVNGVGYSPFGTLQSVLLAPVYGASKLLWGRAEEPYTGYASRFAAAMFNPLVHAAVAALLFLVLCRLGFSRRAGVMVALVYALASWAWPLSRTLFTEHLTALLLLLSFYLLLPVSGRSTRTVLMLSGLSGVCLALAIATRVASAIFVPIFLLYVAWCAWWSRAPHEIAGRRRLGPVAAWVVGFVVGILPLLALNIDLFGGPFSTGYGNQAETFLFATPLYTGLYGLLLSPGKGAFWYAPALLLLFVTWPLFWKRLRPEALLCLAVVGIHTLIYATVQEWPGGGVWGPRYLIPVLPFALVLLAPVWDRGGWLASAPSRASRMLRAATVWTLVIAGVLVNALGAFVNFNVWVVSAEPPQRNFEPYFSAIAAHPRLLGERLGEWRPALAPPVGALLRDGFSYSEGEHGAPLPRWTHADARFTLREGGPLRLKLRYADHRPPTLPRAHVELWRDGQRLDVAPRLLEGINYEIQADVPRAATIELRSDTWNPAAEKQNDRDEDIGVRLLAITRDDGTSLHVEALPQIPPMPRSGFGRWAWFYRPDYHHAVDHWAWYLSVSGAPPNLALRMVLSVIVPSLLCLAAGALLLRSGLRDISPPVLASEDSDADGRP